MTDLFPGEEQRVEGAGASSAALFEPTPVNSFQESIDRVAVKSKAAAAGPAGPAANPFQDSINRVVAKQNANLNRSLGIAVQGNPDDAAETNSLSRSLNLPRMVVEQDQEKFAQQQRSREINDLIAKTPVLQREMLRPDFSLAGHDDVETLSATEKLLRPVEEFGTEFATAAGRSVATAQEAAGYVASGPAVLADLATQMATGKTTTAAQDFAFNQFVQPALENQAFYAPNPNAGFAGQAGAALGGLPMMLLESAATAGVLPELRIGAGVYETFQHAAERAIRTMNAPGLVAALDTGRRVLSETQNPATAFKAALAEYGATLIVGAVPVSAPAKSFLARLLTGSLSGGVATPVAQQIAQAGLPESLQQPLTGKDEAVGMLIGALFGVAFGPRGYSEAEMAAKAYARAAQLEKLSKLREASKLAGRDLPNFESFLNAAGKDGPIETIYIDAQTFNQAAQKAGLDPITLSQISPSAAAQLPNALAYGLDLKIPLGEYIGRISDSDMGAELLAHLKTNLDPNGMSKAEADTYYQKFGEQQRTEAERILGEKETTDAFKESAKAVEQDLLAKHMAAGRFTEDVNKVQAQLQAAMYVTLAARLGKTPEEVYALYPVKVAAETPEGTTGLAQPPTNAEITLRFAERLSNHAAAVEEYSALKDAKGGKVLSTDIARELSEDYLANRGKSVAVHEPASSFIKRMFAEKLKEEPQPGELPLVLFTAGGTGVGKTTAIKQIPGVKSLADQAQIIYDGNMNNFGSARTKIDQARAAGKAVQIVLVIRDPVDSLVKGALKRATSQEAEFGTGRTLPLAEHVNTHVGSIDTILRLAEHYKDDPNVNIRVIDNSRGAENAREITLAEVKKLDYTVTKEAALAALEKEHDEGRISDAIYAGFKQGEADTRTESADGALQQDHRPVAGGEPQPERPQGILQKIGSLFQSATKKPPVRRRTVQETKGRTFDEVGERIPDSEKVISPNTSKTLDGKPFSELPTGREGPGYLPGVDATADAAIVSAMRAAVAAAGLPAEIAARIRTPTAATVDKALRLGNGSRYWYERSADGFLEHYFTLAREGVERLIDAVAGTSGGQAPLWNVRNALAVLSQDTRGVPVTVGLRTPQDATAALAPKAITTHKFGNFAGTMQLLAGLRSRKPLPTIDLQMAKFFGLKPEEVASNPVLVETLQRFILTLRDLQNNKLEGDKQPYESWQIQALLWVHQRGGGEPEDYASVMPEVIKVIEEAGLPLEGGKITVATLADPRLAEVMAPTSKTVGQARTATVETVTLLTKAGKAAAETRGALEGIDTPWARKFREEYESIQRRAMAALGGRPGKGEPSLISRIISSIIGKNVEITQLDTRGFGTFEGAASPNMRIPLAPAGGRIGLSDVQRRHFLAILGSKLKQAAMAASHFSDSTKAEPDTFTVFVKRYDNTDIRVDQLALLSKEIGYPLNYKKVPNGWVIDVNTGGFDTKPVESELASAILRVLGDDPGTFHVLGRDYASDYIDASEYGAAIKEGENAIRGQTDTGRGKGARDPGERVGDLKAHTAAIGEIAKEQDLAFAEWNKRARDKLGERSTLEQAPGEPQGKITFGADIREGATIALLKKANLSTFHHELGHHYLEILSDLASRPDTPLEIKADMDKLLAWFGVLDLATWRSMSLEEKTPHHENFAKGYETYLFEGKVPNLDLHGPLSRARAWMLHVYKNIQETLGIQLTDEVRGVYDRMLATNEQIIQAEEARGFEPYYKTKPEGMTDDAWLAYQNQAQRATQEGVNILQARSLRDMQWLAGARDRKIQELQKDAQAKRKSVQTEVTAEVRKSPLYAVMRFLKFGRGFAPDGREVNEAAFPGGYKLSLPALREMFPHDATSLYPAPDYSRLGFGKYGMLAEDGMHPDKVAEMFGFKSGEDMIAKLIEAEPEASVIEGMTDQRMLEKYGDLTDPQAIERAANAAIHNDARTRFFETELALIEKAAGTKTRTLVAAAKAAASRVVSRLKVRDLKPTPYEAAERKAGRAAMLGKDLKEKAVQMRNRLFNNYAVRAVYDAMDEVMKGVRKLRKLQGAAAQKNMRGDYLEQLNALMERFDLRSSQTLTAIDVRKIPLSKWLEGEADRLVAGMPELPDFILDESYRKHYKDMTVEEFRGLMDTVDQLEHLARREEKQYQAVRNQTFQQERKTILDRIRQFAPKLFDADGKPLGILPNFVPTLAKWIREVGAKLGGEFLSPETMINILEGGQFGDLHESLIQRLSERSTWKTERMQKIFDYVKPLLDQYSFLEKRLFGRRDIGKPAGVSLTRENAVVVALAYGNKEGRERLMNYGWDDAQIQKIIDLLDARDMRLVDGIWKLFDEDLWPELKALNERTRGKSPPKVEPLPYETAHGPARGGYFKLKYDSALDERAHDFDSDAEIKAMFGGGAMGMAKTAQGSSASRVEGVKLRPRLDLGVFAEAVNETVHDIAYREAVADTYRLLRDKQIQNVLKNALGDAGYRALTQKLRDIAAPPRDPAGFIEKAASIARRNTVVNLLSGFNTAIQNLTGFSSSFSRVNAGLMAREIARFFSPFMVERYKFALGQSAFLREYFHAYDRDVRAGLSQLTVRGKIFPETHGFLWLMTMINRAVAVPTWNAAFAEGMRTFANDHGKSVEYANHILRQTQGSGREVDLPQLLAGRGKAGQVKALFTMFNSYFNSQLGQLVRAGAISKVEARESPAAAVANYTARFLALIVMPAMLTTALFKPNEKDDEEHAMRRYVHGLFAYVTGMVPILRDLAGGLWSKFDKTEPDFGYQMSPVESAGQGVIEATKSTADLFSGEADEKDIKHILMGLGYVTGLPGKLISDVSLGTAAWLSGEAGPEAILYGPPKK